MEPFPARVGDQLFTSFDGAGVDVHQIILAAGQIGPSGHADAMTGASYIQRVALTGGVALTSACTTTLIGTREIVK